MASATNVTPCKFLVQAKLDRTVHCLGRSPSILLQIRIPRNDFSSSSPGGSSSSSQLVRNVCGINFIISSLKRP